MSPTATAMQQSPAMIIARIQAGSGTIIEVTIPPITSSTGIKITVGFTAQA